MSSRSLDLLSPVFRLKVDWFLWDPRTKELGVFITCTWRTQKEQNALYAQWRTKPWSIVTWTKKSKHLIPSRAIDIAFSWNELYPKNMNIWNRVYDIAEQYWLLSLYRKYGVDKAHLESNPDKPTNTYINMNLQKEYEENTFKILRLSLSNMWKATDDEEFKEKLAEMGKYMDSKWKN